MHRCPAAHVTGTGCNRTPITYVRTAAGEIGKEEEKGRSAGIKANEPGGPGAKQNADGAEERKSALGRSTKIYLITPTDVNKTVVTLCYRYYGIYIISHYAPSNNSTAKSIKR